MIHYSSPFSLEKDLGKAYNQAISLIPDNDWICFTDGDTLFLTSDYGKQLQEIVDLHPNTGLFTCITNRVGQKQQCYNNTISEDPNILNHRRIALQIQREKRHQVKPLNIVISGHLMLIKKSVWKEVGGFPEGTGLLAVDNKFSSRILRAHKQILLMEGVYLFHYYRLLEGSHDKSHLLV